MSRAILLLCLFAIPASAQTPLGLVQYADPPELNGAPATIYNRHILWNSGKVCVQRPVGTVWECFATQAEVAATTSALASRVTTLEAQVATAQSTANAAQSAATAATSAAAAAQATANSAATASSMNASAVSALATRVTAAEAALAALPKRACTTFTVAAGLSVPATGVSTVQSVPLAGVPVSAVCDTGAPTRMPLGARPDPVVTTAGTVSMAFVSNAGLLSSVIAIPSGTYRLCCDL